MPSPPRLRIQLETLARRGEPAVRRAILQAIATTRAGIPVGRVVEAVRRGDWTGAARAVPWRELGHPIVEQAVLRQLYRVAGEAGSAAVASVQTLANVDRRGRTRFDIADPARREFLETRGAERITEISANTEAGVRATLLTANQQGWPALEIARQVQERVGLTERYATAVGNRMAEMEERGYSPADIRREAERYTQELVQHRALDIARTEMAMAAFAGAKAGFEQMRADGLMTDEATKTWDPSPDPCPVCEFLGGQTVPYDGSFVGPDGEEIGDDEPPHPNCRCGVSVSPDGEAFES